MPKGYESTVETRRKINAPSYYTAPATTPKATGKKEVVIVKGKGEKLSAIPYGLLLFFFLFFFHSLFLSTFFLARHDSSSSHVMSCIGWCLLSHLCFVCLFLIDGVG